MPGDGPQLVALASGKGGVGKTLISVGIAWYLAKIGYRVTIADLDFGVGNLHLSVGIGRTDSSLDDFLRDPQVDLNSLLVAVPNNEKLAILPGAGRRSSITGVTLEQKQELVERLGNLRADFVVLDLGAGCSLDNLDYFYSSDHQIVVATGDLSSMIALTAFLKKAQIHAILKTLPKLAPSLADIARREFSHVAEIYAAIEPEMGEVQSRSLLNAARTSFKPSVLLNRLNNDDNAQVQRVGKNLERQFSIPAHILGKIPDDVAVTRCRRLGQNVFYHEPSSPACRALAEAADSWHQQYYLMNASSISKSDRSQLKSG